MSDALAGLRLDDLLAGVQQRLTELSSAGDRLQALLAAVLAVGAGLELDSTLRRIVRVAAELVGAGYGALAVRGEEPRLLSEFTREPDGAARVRSGEPPSGPGVLDVPVRVRDEVFGNLYLAGKKDGGRFTADDEIVLRSLAAAAGVAVENARLFEHSRMRERWFEATGTINATILADADVHETLHLIAELAKEVAGADVTLIVLGRDGGRLTIAAAAGERAGLLAGGSVSGTDPVVGDVLRTGETKLVADLNAVPRAERAMLGSEFGPAVVAAMRKAGDTGGVLLAARRQGAPRFGADLLTVLSSFAAQATVALEFTGKQHRERQLAVLADRDRIAHDLHDHVIQRLFATGMVLQGTLKHVKDGHAVHRITSAVKQLDEIVQEIRTSIFDLHTSDGGAKPSSVRRRLLDAAAEVSEDTPVTPSIRISGAVDTLVPDELTGHLEAVVRTGLRHALRHASASWARLHVQVGHDAVVEVAHDGPGNGFDEHGLADLRVRAAACGGAVVLAPGAAGETVLTWRAPLPGQGEARVSPSSPDG
ncbi:sensor histidine kinase [Prauserella flavalba]|uniref:sensor histidine kinase n=1 Tax=Prauserella flavalba TaxID=1477506 RepID=UPI0036F17724